MSSDALYARTQESLRRSGEVVLVPSDRSAMLPTGGIFSPLRREPGRVDLGPPLLQRLADLEPEPVVALALAERVLQDVELLHRLGGAHGAIDLDGWGFDDAGYFRVRPIFRADQELSQDADIRAVAAAVSALVTPEALEFAGFAQAKVWFQSLGSSRLGDARSVRQGLVAMIGRRPVQEPVREFLARVGGQLPPLARSFDVVPVVAPRPDQRLNQRDRAQTDARLWVEAERQRMAAEREQRRAALLARPDLQSWYEEEQKKADQARFAREFAVAEAEAERRRLLERRREDERQRREATPVEAMEDEDSPVPFRTVQSPVVIHLEEPGGLPPLGPNAEPAPTTEEDSSGPVRIQVDLREEDRSRLRDAVAVESPQAAPLSNNPAVGYLRTPKPLTSLFEVDPPEFSDPHMDSAGSNPRVSRWALKEEAPAADPEDLGPVVEGLPSDVEDDGAEFMALRSEGHGEPEASSDMGAMVRAAVERPRAAPAPEEEPVAPDVAHAAVPAPPELPLGPVRIELPIKLAPSALVEVGVDAVANEAMPVNAEDTSEHDDEATDPGFKQRKLNTMAAKEAEAARERAAALAEQERREAKLKAEEEERRQAKLKADVEARLQEKLKAVEETRRQAKLKADEEERRQARVKAEEEERRQAKLKADEAARQAKLKSEEEERRQAKLKVEEEERRQAKLRAEAEVKKKEEDVRVAAAKEAQRRSEEAAQRREAEERRRNEELSTQRRLEEGRARVAEELARREAAGKGSAGDARSRLIQDPVRALNKAAAAEEAEALRASREPAPGGGKWSELRASANPIVLPPPMKVDVEDLDAEAVLPNGRSVAEAGTWEGAPGISGSHERDGEKGPGKWTAAGRSVEELQDALPAGESRPLTLEQKGGGSMWMALGVILMGGALGIAGWMFFGA